LQQMGMIGKMIEDFCGGQAIAFQLQFEVLHREPLVAVASRVSCK
jgi:hypothetical protein